MKTIAVLGLGEMGKRMASNYLDAGYIVHIWNRTELNVDFLIQKGAKLFKTPKETVLGVDAAISMVRDDIASKEVWLNPQSGAISAFKEHMIAIECSTISLEWCMKLHQTLENKNISFLDAPVVGSRPQADQKQLIHLIGGEKEILSSVNDILSVNAINIYHVGSTGAGTSMKLAVNGIFGMQITALSETLSLLNNVGIEKENAVEILNQLPITSPALLGIGIAISNDNYEALFPIDLVEKDFSYLMELTHTQENLDSPIKLNHNIYKKAKKQGYGKDNIAGVAQLFQ